MEIIFHKNMCFEEVTCEISVHLQMKTYQLQHFFKTLTHVYRLHLNIYKFTYVILHTHDIQVHTLNVWQ